MSKNWKLSEVFLRAAEGFEDSDDVDISLGYLISAGECRRIAAFLESVPSEKTPINKVGAPITVTSTEPQSDPTLPGGLFPKAELSDECATIYVTFREIKDGDVAKCVQRMVAASCDYDAAGKLIGVEIFDVLPEPA